MSPLPDRIANKIEQLTPDGCWEWTAYRNKCGYGHVPWQGKTKKAHRLVWELLVGDIPDGLDLDHLCRNPGCVRPDHLEPVSRRENLLRGKTVPRANLEKTHCPQGHPYAGENLRVEVDGARKCRECDRKRSRERYWVRKAA